jgi:hypothetical protein
VTPQQPEGTVWCFDVDGQPEVAWTIDSESVLGIISGENGDSLNPLYKWWASHYQ